MKKYLVLFLAIVCSLSIHAQEFNKVEEYAPGKKMHLGKVNLQGFNSEDFSWWKENYDKYHPNDHVVQSLKDSINDYTIKVFFGSWCGDSKRNVPIFFNVMDKAGYDSNKIELIALDKREGAYKQSPTHEEKGLYIHRVPTFIFYKDGKEVNRIVERPHSTMEHDIKRILDKKEKTAPYYSVANFLIKYFKADQLKELKSKKEDLVSYLSDFLKGSKELNTLGIVLIEAKEYDKAEFVLDLNSKIYPYKDYTYSILGNLYNEKEEYTKALKMYHKALSINPGTHFDEKIKALNEKLSKEKKDKKSKK